MAIFLTEVHAENVKTLRFSFMSGQNVPNYTKISIKDAFSEKSGFGMENQQTLTANPSESTFSGTFSVLLPSGNYDVKATFGGVATPTATTLKIENRRVILPLVRTSANQVATAEFTANIRTPEIAGQAPVKINGRESGPPMVGRWDAKLTFEILGETPGLRTLEITPNPVSLTIYLAGDSTVTEQPNEPYAGWGQMLSAFFGPGTAVANHAESGLALSSFRSQRRLEKILSDLRPDDYVFIQFGHNDQKEKTPGSGPFTTYKTRLGDYIRDIREKNGRPVLVTPMERRRFKAGNTFTTLHDFAQAVRQVGAEEKVPVIDLHAMSLRLYQALGEEASRKAFVHYPAGTFPGQTKMLEDDTHHNAYGGMELAKCVVEGIRGALPELAARLRPGLPVFDPDHPDPPADFALPPSPTVAAPRPAGN
ncbi:MAG: hypothetical protein JWL81_919 [Verrucomicrobiales bacterium]|nr:hypothetical protein [Verrucomicrobiales bacterium]